MNRKQLVNLFEDVSSKVNSIKDSKVREYVNYELSKMHACIHNGIDYIPSNTINEESAPFNFNEYLKSGQFGKDAEENYGRDKKVPGDIVDMMNKGIDKRTGGAYKENPSNDPALAKGIEKSLEPKSNTKAPDITPDIVPAKGWIERLKEWFSEHWDLLSAKYHDLIANYGHYIGPIVAGAIAGAAVSAASILIAKNKQAANIARAALLGHISKEEMSSHINKMKNPHYNQSVIECIIKFSNKPLGKDNKQAIKALQMLYGKTVAKKILKGSSKKK